MGVPDDAFAVVKFICWDAWTKLACSWEEGSCRCRLHATEAKLFRHALSVSEGLVRDCESPEDAWENPNVYLKKRFFQIEIEAQDAQDDLKEIKDLANGLVALVLPISEEDELETLLGSL